MMHHQIIQFRSRKPKKRNRFLSIVSHVPLQHHLHVTLQHYAILCMQVMVNTTVLMFIRCAVILRVVCCCFEISGVHLLDIFKGGSAQGAIHAVVPRVSRPLREEI